MVDTRVLVQMVMLVTTAPKVIRVLSGCLAAVVVFV